MRCTCTVPGICPLTGRRVRWAEIQVCHSHGTDEPTPAAPARTCRDCYHRGDPALAANGKQIGTEGCGCTSESAPSGVLWWTCNLTDLFVRESKASLCDNFTPKGT